MEKNNLRRIVAGILFWGLGYLCNKFLYSHFAFFQDWIWGVYSIGDCLYILGYSLILSVVWR